ncbi:MAG: cytochrome c biogenesis protein ResB, partial [Desulfuromonadales bacterium]|nr:cytochrome c biogenesis protein ResB [Desulfuromonadales bacterium]
MKKRNFLTVVWDFFCSLKLTITTLILLAVTSIIGTVLPQTSSPQENLQRFGETKFKIFQALDFFDMYHSWWFLGLMAIFSLNLIACSIKRLPRVMKTVKEPKLIPDEAHYRSLSNRMEYVSPQSVSELREKMTNLLKKNFASPVISEEGERV